MDYKQRNDAIKSDRSNGMSLSEIAEKWGISVERVRQICTALERSESMKNDSLWQRLMNAAESIGGYDESMVARTYNIVKRGKSVLVKSENGKVVGIEHTPFKEVPREKWHELRNCGKKTLKLLYEAFPE